MRYADHYFELQVWNSLDVRYGNGYWMVLHTYDTKAAAEKTNTGNYTRKRIVECKVVG